MTYLGTNQEGLLNQEGLFGTGGKISFLVP